MDDGAAYNEAILVWAGAVVDWVVNVEVDCRDEVRVGRAEVKPADGTRGDELGGVEF
jgi:hypothetical protein